MGDASMNEHSKRLIENVLHSVHLYEQKRISEKELEQDIEGNRGAVEEHYIEEKLLRFIIKIDESINLYDAEEGRRILLKEIQTFKTNIIQ